MERSRRLRKGREFDTAYKEGAVVGGPLLVVRHLPNGLGHPRWGFAVGKRIARKAVDRNRTKRRLREVARATPLSAGADVIVTARVPALTASPRELRHAIERGLRKAGLLGAAE